MGAERAEEVISSVRAAAFVPDGSITGPAQTTPSNAWGHMRLSGTGDINVVEAHGRGIIARVDGQRAIGTLISGLGEISFLLRE
jgi:hypothetical protein